MRRRGLGCFGPCGAAPLQHRRGVAPNRDAPFISPCPRSARSPSRVPRRGTRDPRWSLDAKRRRLGAGATAEPASVGRDSRAGRGPKRRPWRRTTPARQSSLAEDWRAGDRARRLGREGVCTEAVTDPVPRCGESPSLAEAIARSCGRSRPPTREGGGGGGRRAGGPRKGGLARRGRAGSAPCGRYQVIVGGGRIRIQHPVAASVGLGFWATVRDQTQLGPGLAESPGRSRRESPHILPSRQMLLKVCVE